ncbi:MAG: phosphatase PAP2 family protein [Candidatus Sulfopaludibacter sp.]|nr:phosphatase PAP2 family protein [Candidatus Sulfopaludibacter sp.]
MERDNRAWIAGFAVAVLAALFFAALAHAVVQGATQSFDASVRSTIHSWATPQLTGVMSGVTQLGSVTVLLPLGVILVWRLYAAGRPRAAVLLAVTVLGAQVFDQALKFGFRRPRPAVFFDLAQPGTYSFPSGHSVTSCCFYGVLAAILTAGAVSWRRKVLIWAVAVTVTLAVGFSRVYLGVHYPTDVLGGYAVAVVWVAMVRVAYEMWLAKSRK